jgi:Phage late-transcription coactivator
MINLTSNNFSFEIDKLCHDKGIDYIDAVVLWCERNKVEVEYAASLIKKDPVFKSKIQVEAENLNILKRSARLPI